MSANGYGIWQAFGNPFPASQYPEVRGRLCNFRWKDLETSPGVWYWKDFDNDLTSRTQDGLPVIFMVYTKEDAPDWLYSNGVPKVTETDNKGNVTGYSPYYADPDYKSYFKKMISKVHQHIESLPASVRNGIVGVQGCFGSTGDYISYKGNVADKYYLSGTDFYGLFQEFTQYYYDEYKNTSPRISLLSNPKNGGEDQSLWVIQNCPGGWLKCGTLGKAYQLNDEIDKSAWLFDVLNQPQSGDYVRARSEITGSNLSSGWWKEAPYKSMFAIMSYAIYWGLDWPNQGGDQISDKNFDPAFIFFNKYSGQKNAGKATNAMCALKDGLDASDDKRFPASKYGSVDRNNQQRYKNIVNDFSLYGALLEDPATATKPEMDELSAQGLNDVGWRIFAGNYDRYLHQLTPNQTSAGYWNVQCADNNSMYGRFARGFDIAKNKAALYFDVEDAFLNNAPLNGKYSVTIEVTYLDNGGGSFQLYYDAKSANNKRSIQITCGSSNKWKKASVTLSDAYFGNRGQNGSDFSLRSTNNKNVIFSLVELSRPKNFANASAQSFTASQAVNNVYDTNATKAVLLADPNPVKENFSIFVKDNSMITDVLVYDASGQLILRKKVSASRIQISRKEIGSTPGVYYIKAFSGHTCYTTKITVL
jgi:hypothetical protein